MGSTSSSEARLCRVGSAWLAIPSYPRRASWLPPGMTMGIEHTRPAGNHVARQTLAKCGERPRFMCIRLGGASKCIKVACVLVTQALNPTRSISLPSRSGRCWVSAALIRQTFCEAIAATLDRRAFCADIMAVADRDPACLRMMSRCSISKASRRSRPTACRIGC